MAAIPACRSGVPPNGRRCTNRSDPLETLSADAKVRLLEAVDAEARRQDPRVTQVMVSLAAVRDTILIADSDGTLAGDVRPLVRLNVSVIVEHDGRREQGSSGGGGRSATAGSSIRIALWGTRGKRCGRR